MADVPQVELNPVQVPQASCGDDNRNNSSIRITHLDDAKPLQELSTVITDTNDANLDECSELFDKWQAMDLCLVSERDRLREKLGLCEVERHRAVNRAEELERTSQLQTDMVDSLQAQLFRLSEVEKENKELKSVLSLKDSKISELKNTIEENGMQFNSQILSIRTDHKEEINQLVEKNKLKMEECMKNMTEKVEEKEREINSLKDKAEVLQRDKQGEITKLTMDYENKIANMHRQNVATSMNQQSMTNQEIFRKKLQHVKVEYEREITSLKSAIANLQEKLTNQVTVTSANTASREKLSLMGQKKRKF